MPSVDVSATTQSSFEPSAQDENTRSDGGSEDVVNVPQSHSTSSKNEDQEEEHDELGTLISSEPILQPEAKENITSDSQTAESIVPVNPPVVQSRETRPSLTPPAVDSTVDKRKSFSWIPSMLQGGKKKPGQQVKP